MYSDLTVLPLSEQLLKAIHMLFVTFTLFVKCGNEHGVFLKLIWICDLFGLKFVNLAFKLFNLGGKRGNCFFEPPCERRDIVVGFIFTSVLLYSKS